MNHENQFAQLSHHEKIQLHNLYVEYMNVEAGRPVLRQFVCQQIIEMVGHQAMFVLHGVICQIRENPNDGFLDVYSIATVRDIPDADYGANE